MTTISPSSGHTDIDGTRFGIPPLPKPRKPYRPKTARDASLEAYSKWFKYELAPEQDCSFAYSDYAPWVALKLWDGNAWSIEYQVIETDEGISLALALDDVPVSVELVVTESVEA